MKKLALVVLLGSMSPIALYAHCGVCGVGEKHDSPDAKTQAINVDQELANMTEALSLDAAQQAKIKPLLGKCCNAPAGKDKKAQKCPVGLQKEIRKVLNKDQQAKWDELSKEKPACCPTPWTKCAKCCAMSSAKPCCPLAGQKGHQCPPKTKGATCPMDDAPKE